MGDVLRGEARGVLVTAEGCTAAGEGTVLGLPELADVLLKLAPEVRVSLGVGQ